MTLRLTTQSSIVTQRRSPEAGPKTLCVSKIAVLMCTLLVSSSFLECTARGRTEKGRPEVGRPNIKKNLRCENGRPNFNILKLCFIQGKLLDFMSCWIVCRVPRQQHDSYVRCSS